MLNKEARIGNFTSSEIYKLMENGRQEGGFSTKGIEYINEKRIEKRLGRSLDIETYSRAMAWGTFLEQRVLDLLGLEYQLISDITKKHPSIDGWVGSQDLLVTDKKISDIKCLQPKNFALYTDALLSKDIELIRDNFPDKYWQLVSNAIINEVPNAEAITYMPYLSELKDIREMAMNYQNGDHWKFRFIYEEIEANLPYLPEGGYYKNLNIFEFVVPEEDKKALTARVVEAIKLLNK